MNGSTGRCEQIAIRLLLFIAAVRERPILGDGGALLRQRSIDRQA